MKTEKFFAVCECGSVAWLVEGSKITETDELDCNGDTHCSIELDEFKEFIDEKKMGVAVYGVYCLSCERILEPIFFSEIDINERKRIFRMNSEERKKWIAGYKIIKEMEKEDEEQQED